MLVQAGERTIPAFLDLGIDLIHEEVLAVVSVLELVFAQTEEEATSVTTLMVSVSGDIGFFIKFREKSG
jgi:hypothetical protein